MSAIIAAAVIACGTPPSPRVGEPAPAASLAATPIGRLIDVGTKPEGIAVDSARGLVAVAVRAPAAIAILDRQGNLIRRIPLTAAARHLRFDANSGLVLVPAEQAQQLIKVDPQAGTIVSTTMVGRQPHDAVAVGDRVFVTNEFSDTVSVIESARVVATIAAPRQPGGIAESDGLVAVVGVRSHSLAVIDSKSWNTIATVSAGDGPTHVVGGAGGQFFVTDTVGNALLVFAATPALQIRTRVSLAGTPYGLALDEVHHRLFVSLTAKNQVVEFDVAGKSPVEVRRLPTPREPNSVAVDPASGAIVVTGAADGVVQIVSSFS
jgi:YVTN family beta-propeller protein